MRYAMVVAVILFACAGAWCFEAEESGSGRQTQFRSGESAVGDTLSVGQGGGERKERVMSVNEGSDGSQMIKTYDPQSGKYWLYRTEAEGEGGGEGAGDSGSDW